MLEHKVPPPLLGLLVGAAMWFGAHISPRVQVQPTLRLAMALALVGVGFAIALSGVVAFKQARTTLNPMKPETASALVVVGVYRYTRNPMYLGLAAILLGWTVYLAAPFVLLGPVLFVWFITRFQIIPEERVLIERFGDPFLAYLREVHRWI